LDRPYVRRDGKLTPASWGEAFAAISEAVADKTVAAIAGDLVPVEAAFALKGLIGGAGGNLECRVDGAALPMGNRAGYVGTARIEDIDAAEMILLIGTNPRLEAPVLNARIRKAWARGAKVAMIGEAVDLTYDVTHLGTGRAALADLAAMDHSDKQDVAGVTIIGQDALTGPDGAAVLATVMRMAAAAHSKLLVLQTAAGRVGAMDLGFATEGGLEAALSGADVVYNMGADEVDLAPGTFVIYQGSHGDRGAHRADVILPGAAYTEESGIFVNMEGRPQMASRAGFPPGQAKENWAIVRALSAELGATLPYNSLAELRSQMFAEHPHLGQIDEVPENEGTAADAGEMGTGDFTASGVDHYQVNPILRASTVMADLSKLAAERQKPLAAE
ncbi:MAG: molybdopterin-dependent oxidoreductase, partial [Pseudomonadota bacterium]